MRKLKAELDKVSNDMQATEECRSKLPGKGYPPAMVEWFGKELKKTQEKIDGLHAKYIKAMTDITTSWSAEELTKSTVDVGEIMKDVIDEHKNFKTGTGQDIKHLGR